MTKRDYSSRAQQTTLSGSLTSSATTTTVGSGANLMGGVTPATSTYTVVIDPDTALEEIVDVTAVSGNILTITRGIDGSTGVAHSAGAIVRHMVIGRDLREANQHSENVTTAHGITLANVVKTTDSGTVTSTMLLDGTILNEDINAAAGIVDTKLATIATAGKVSNSATTAASANTASAIVARDASGNFAAGTITASLAGTASLDLPLAGGTMSGAIAMGTSKITGLGLATVGTDAASKTYVDGVLVAPSNLTGVITSVGVATSIASQTGTGTKFVVDTGPTLIDPILSITNSKATPVDLDEIPLADSAATFGLKKLTWANLKATLLAYFNTFYEVIGNYATTATAAGTTTLTVSSPRRQVFTGTTTQTVLLPVTSTLPNTGYEYKIINKSTGIVTVQSSGANTVYAIPANTTATFMCILLTGTTAASWSFDWAGASATPVSGGGMTLLQTITVDNTVGTYTLSSLGSHKHIIITGESMTQSGAAAAAQWKMRFNGDTAATSYVYAVAMMNGATYSAKTTGGSSQESALVMCDPAGASIAPTGQNDYRSGTFAIQIYDYNTAVGYKPVFWEGGSVSDGTTTWSKGRGMWVNIAAITSITLLMTAGTFMTGTIKVWAVD